MKDDGFGEVFNDSDTFKHIAHDLKDNTSVIIGWTDDENTHYDILFTYKAKSYGILQGGIAGDYLFVSIMRLGSFGFDVVAKDTSPEYYGEKLFVSGIETQKKLADLINGVKKQLKK